MTVRYTGVVPDPFAEGRAVMVNVTDNGGPVFVGQENTLTTKCPSKYQAAAGATASMAQLGRAILLLDLVVCLYGIVASIYGARARRSDWVDSGRRAVLRPCRPQRDRLRSARGRVPAQRLLVQGRGEHVLHDYSRLLQADGSIGRRSRVRCCCG